MPPEAKKLLADMRRAVELLRQFLAGKEFSDLKSDELLRSGVYFQFFIIGEALSQLRQMDESILTRISEATRIIGFRNHIAHGYVKIDDEITWRIYQTKLPILEKELEALLGA